MNLHVLTWLCTCFYMLFACIYMLCTCFYVLLHEFTCFCMHLLYSDVFCLLICCAFWFWFLCHVIYLRLSFSLWLGNICTRHTRTCYMLAIGPGWSFWKGIGPRTQRPKGDVILRQNLAICLHSAYLNEFED